jgi:NhaP-type Na+/H+ or K+/H+ antiporter
MSTLTADIVTTAAMVAVGIILLGAVIGVCAAWVDGWVKRRLRPKSGYTRQPTFMADFNRRKK